MGHEKDNNVSLNLWIVCKYKKGKRKQHGIEYFAYVVYKSKVNLSYIHQDYRTHILHHRFPIENNRLKSLLLRRVGTAHHPFIEKVQDVSEKDLGLKAVIG
ncbi:hypothetical protein NUACC21_29520 [Scytonema sp. NUACC21]